MAFPKGHKSVSYWKGKHVSEEVKEKISKSLKGRKPTWLIGKKLSEEHKKKIGDASRGEKGNNWQGGKTLTERLLRKSTKYKNWRKEILVRDNYACVLCYSKEKIEVDHINSFTFFPNLRFLLSNGRTLCHECHKQTDSYGGKTRKFKNELWKSFR